MISLISKTIFFSSLFFIVSLISIVIFRYPENHISYNPKALYLFAVALVLLQGLALFLNSEFSAKKVLWNIAPSVFCVVIVFLVDGFNLLVQHDIWIYRGMPNAGEFVIYPIERE